ncbi:DUF3891 family protein [Rhodocytophaga aerolata]|uniref:DUF3891 family protein n=1 Tax=Rhodocytophaga aerolata TaxID=455078 RepID=A0ABT8R356_9BACT|nr:DUF3891 family protein [Rhodocytophaga aerolata]MDO1445718.1 DUF3891 family protein [Rhodocytophaga aerolata]
MIVNTDPKGWEVIHQRAHGLLAMKIASQWRKDQRPHRWIETLLATAEHDDGQEDWTGTNHINEAGAPLDFIHKRFNMVQLKRITELSQHKGQWIALLISMHMSFLYESMRGKEKELDSFLDEQKQHQEQWRKSLKVSQQEVKSAYALMQWCDRFSLILCRNELPAGERLLEVSTGPDGTKYEVMQQGDKTVIVKPWPFEEDRFELSIEATYLNQLSFKNDQELLATLKKSAIKDKAWLLSKA